jgi:DNA-binding MarR family transcriptional regulator
MADDMTKELAEIRRLLNILVLDKVEPLRAKIENDHLKTKEQKAAYKYFDGKHTMEDIAARAKISTKTVGRLVAELEGKGLLVVEHKGTKRFPKNLI